MEQWRVLLNKYIGEARIAIFYPTKGKGHINVKRVKKTNFITRNWVYQIGQKGIFKMCKNKNQMLNILSDPRQGLISRYFGKKMAVNVRWV